MPKLLDLFCGAGLASYGYHSSGLFSEIVGVDLQPLGGVYPYTFIQADAMSFDQAWLSSFDFIHASPPCQAYSRMTPARYKERHKRLVAPVHEMLRATGRPYVIENVGGSLGELQPNLNLTGLDFGLPTLKSRWFHLSWIRGVRHQPNYGRMIDPERISVHGQAYTRKADIIRAMGLQALPHPYLRRLTMRHMEQGIPPEMTRFIAQIWAHPENFALPEQLEMFA